MAFPAEFSFDAVFAVDQHGRVVSFIGYEQAMGMEDFELGGYPVVADALHGFIRDDTLVLDRIYRVVARPVEFELGQMPAGAIVGARIIDDRFARELSQRTNSAVAFYTKGTRAASGAPGSFDKSQMDQIVSDMTTLDSDKDYAEKGRSSLRRLYNNLGVVYAKLPGEAWALGAGYAVGRVAPHADDPLDFFRHADDTDKKRVNVVLVGLVSLGAALLGILFSVLEHTRTLGIFRREAARLAKGRDRPDVPQQVPRCLSKIASDLNDGIDKVAAKGGVPRRAADLTQVLGDLPAEPQMSAFALPGEGGAVAPPPSAPVQERPMIPAAPAGPQLPKAMPAPPSAEARPRADEEPTGHGRPPPPRRGVPAGAPPPPSRVQAGGRQARRMAASIQGVRGRQTEVWRVRGGLHLREVRADPAQERGGPHAASRCEAGQVQRLRQGRQGGAESESRQGLTRRQNRAMGPE